jgi:hypothetical protein
VLGSLIPGASYGLDARLRIATAADAAAVAAILDRSHGSDPNKWAFITEPVVTPGERCRSTRP